METITPTNMVLRLAPGTSFPRVIRQSFVERTGCFAEAKVAKKGILNEPLP